MRAYVIEPKNTQWRLGLNVNLTSIWCVSNTGTKEKASNFAHLAYVVMFKQGQQADITVTFDPLQESDVAIAWVQLHVIVKDIRHCSTTEQQVDQLLVKHENMMLVPEYTVVCSKYILMHDS